MDSRDSFSGRDDNKDCYYYLRSKKRKLDDGGEEATCSYKILDASKRKNPVMHAPIEVLQNVFKFISYQDLSNKVRMVNRRFKIAAESILNRTFKGLSKKLQGLICTTHEALTATQDDMEIKCLCRLLNMLDVMMFQQSVILATIWRYVYNDFYRTRKSCMYAGQILDLFEHFFHEFTTAPYDLYAQAVAKDAMLPDGVHDICQMTKSFCLHFDKLIEETMEKALSSSGCKIVDLLNCANCCRRTVLSESINVNTFHAKYSYYFQNTWFLTFPVPSEKDMTSRQKQRLMHLRVRRLVLAHSDMFMQQNQYERETVVRINPLVKKPNVAVYTGYGDVFDTFFCYGTMNDAAYIQKFHIEEPDDDDDDDDEDDANEAEDQLNNENIQREGENPDDAADEMDDIMFTPHLGLYVEVTVECPLAYAPLRYILENLDGLSKHEADSLDVLNSKKEKIGNGKEKGNGKINVSVCFNCPGACYLRLPSHFRFNKSTSTRQSQ